MKIRAENILSRFVRIVLPEGGDIQVAAFNILAICGMVVCVVTGIYNLVIGLPVGALIANTCAILFCVGVMIYTQKTGNYRRAMILTVFAVFIGLFSYLFFVGGGYHSGIPAFFIFAVVFTAFLLDGIIMPVLVVFEMAWYAGLCLYAYYNPLPSDLTYNETKFMTDVVVCVTIVSISLAITMYLQILVYRKKQEELNDAIFATKEASKAKSDFLAKMSHDIRTPLNTIMAVNELMLSNASPETKRELLGDSNVSARILLSLIDDMLDLTRIESGKLELLRQPYGPSALFGETEKIWRLQAEKQNLQFDYHYENKIPGTLIGDEAAIRKVVNNLLSNAVKYTKIGMISLDVGWEIKDPDDTSLKITVMDTGAGIAPEYLEKIFMPFERGVQEIYRETSGSGLGLAIVKELVDAMNGQIDCKSVLDEGTEFTVLIPQKEASETKDASLSKILPDADGFSDNEDRSVHFVAPDARILVVDDNPYNRKVIEGFLEPTLIRLDDVESGFEALEMIDIKDYDLVFMDLRMPKMDGVETLERIKKEYPGFNAPVIALTADIMNDVEKTLLEKGFDGFLSKPVSSERLIKTIRHFVPDKIRTLKDPSGNVMTLSDLERYQGMLKPYGIDLKSALEFNAGNAEEFLTRAELFETYSEMTMSSLSETDPISDYYLQVHSLKSIARGVGAVFLAELSETAELRKDEGLAKMLAPVILEEYKKVRQGLNELLEETGVSRI